MAAAPALTPARRAVAGALLYLGAATLAGVSVPAAGVGVEYHTFGITEGLLALLLTYVLLTRRVWHRPAGVLGWLAISYGTVANAQLWDLLLPPPGLVEWIVVAGLALVAWAALMAGSRQRLLASLTSLAVLLALLKFSVIPTLWRRSAPTGPDPLGIGNLAEGFRRFFVAEPPSAGGELFGFAALCCWVLGTYLLWPPEDGKPDGALRERIERVLKEE